MSSFDEKAVQVFDDESRMMPGRRKRIIIFAYALVLLALAWVAIIIAINMLNPVLAQQIVDFMAGTRST